MNIEARTRDALMRKIVQSYQKKLKRLFVVPIINRRYIRRPAVFESIGDVDSRKLFVITVAFNDEELIALQHETLKKYLRDPYEYFVIDNSSREEQSEKMKGYCFQNKINYVRLPENIYWNGGVSHGLALNWTYRNIIQKFKPAIFGFMDHDLFPVEPISIVGHLAAGDAWGITMRRRPSSLPWKFRLYLWAGLAFYCLEKFKKRTPNFLPGFGVDTCGRIALDEDALVKLSDVFNLENRKPIEIVPGINVYEYGAFVHFQGASSEPMESLEMKKKWIRDKLR